MVEFILKDQYGKDQKFDTDAIFVQGTNGELIQFSQGGGGSSADVRYVTFTNASTGETFVKPVIKGDDCVDVVAKGLWATPTQASTAQYDYAFANSWSATPNGSADANILKNITEDKTVYAVFTATLRKYTITWLDSDGVTELPGQKQWAYGTVPTYTPSKEGVVFDSWTPTPTEVTGDATYTAVWATIEASGTFQKGMGTDYDTGITWALYPDGKVVISGVGRIPDYGLGNTFSPLKGNEKITSVVIGEGITKVGDAVFGYCPNLASISFPDSLNIISLTAVYQCTSLSSIAFKNTAGWFEASSKTATSGTAIDVTDPAANATNAKAIWGSGKYWKRT